MLSNVADSEACADDVRVLTYNFFLRPPLVKTNDHDHKDSRLEYFLQNVLPNYDIVAFQEVFSFMNGRARYLIREAKLKGFNYHVSSTTRGLWFGVDGGLVLLSRFEIVDSEFVEFQKAAIADRLAAKGILYAKIAVRPSSFLHVFTTHMQASSHTTTRMDDPTVVVRLYQTRELRDFMISKLHDRKASEPVMILGDFNVNGRGVALNNGAISAHSMEYALTLMTLRCEDYATRYPVRDLLFEKLGYHPVTYGDSDHENKPLDTVLTHPADYGCAACLDYIFWIDGIDPVITVDMDRTSIEKFFVTERSFTQLSGKCN